MGATSPIIVNEIRRLSQEEGFRELDKKMGFLFTTNQFVKIKE